MRNSLIILDSKARAALLFAQDAILFSELGYTFSKRRGPICRESQLRRPTSLANDMYSVPWPLSPAEVEMLESPIVAQAPHVDNLDVELERLKEQVGVFRAIKGDETWKKNVEAVDKTIHLQRVVERPVSRAYFKLIEILRTCAIRDPQSSLHLCEAPGGFAQAVASEFPKTTRIMVTSRRTEGAPLFSSRILSHERISELDLEHNDLMRRDTRDEIVNLVKQVDLVTADGAIDNETRPELAEDYTAWLLACEIETALRVQKTGGSFVVKVFGFMRAATRQLVALLTTCYEQVCIIKPVSSRSVNDERYVICQRFKGCKGVLFDTGDRPGGVLIKIANVNDAWLQEAHQIACRMSHAQKHAITQALNFKSTSSGGKWSSRPPRGRGRQSQSGYREQSRRPPASLPVPKSPSSRTF
mgnify:CR=1 FL=1